jgi:hypothetical protein
LARRFVDQQVAVLLYNRPMRPVLAALVLVSTACSPGNRLTDASPRIDSPAEAPPPDPADACVGLQCQVAPCQQQGLPSTTISGTVYMPNGELPLFNATVYVPTFEPPPFTEGVQCVNCASELPGKPIALSVTNELGRFTLENAPVGTDIPLIIAMGKWRRRLVLPNVTACTDNPVDPAATRLPRNRTEGDIPKMAIATGSCDALECLLRKIGIEDSEFTSDSGSGRIHMFNSGGATRAADGALLSPSTSLWSDRDKLMQYDIGVFSCECSTNTSNKSQVAMNNMKAYADAGGRLFLSHYHYIWITSLWSTVATCPDIASQSGNGFIDTINNPKGTSFSLWMEYVMGSPFPGVIPITEGRQSCSNIDNTKAERWVYFPNSSGTAVYPQNFQFSTPNEVVSNQRCGKVVFSDMHVASGSSSSGMFPSGCSATPTMTPQEKALAFMFFDIASCVGVIIQ